MAREALVALAEQQQLIEDHQRAFQKHAQQQNQTAQTLLSAVKLQQQQIERLTTGLQTISVLAGVEHKVATSMGLKFVEADVMNPGDPVAEPPAVPPTESTVETKTPEAFADVQAPGLVPGSTQDVAADVTTTNYTPGQDIPGPAFKNLQDVTAPIDGTQGARPTNETRTEVDVRAGDPMNPQTAFPLRGDFANGQRVAAKTHEEIAADAQLRTMASLRLARLRMQAGLEKADLDLTVQERIVKDASLSIDDIEKEIATLDAVLKRTVQVQKDQRGRGLVPKSASARPLPSMAGGGQSAPTSDEDLFLNF